MQYSMTVHTCLLSPKGEEGWFVSLHGNPQQVSSNVQLEGIVMVVYNRVRQTIGNLQGVMLNVHPDVDMVAVIQRKGG